MSKFEETQPNGECWDCGAKQGEPVVDVRNEDLVVISLGWYCGVCGRWWPVHKHDLKNWIVKYMKQDTAKIKAANFTNGQ